MTRYRDLMCEDIWGCDHKPTIPISEGGEILYWRCTCGAKQVAPDEGKPQGETKPEVKP